MYTGEMTETEAGRSSASQFREGLFLLAEGAGFLRRERRLWPLAVIPVFFATLLVGVAVALFWVRLETIHSAWLSVLPVLEATDWWAWIWVGPGKLVIWLLGWLGVVVAFALSLIAALLLANLVSAPFLDQLSQRVERIARGELLATSAGSDGVIRETLRSFAAELQRLAFLGFIWIALSGVGFVVPGAHLVTGPLLVVVTVLLLPLDYAGFALDRRQIPFRSRRRWLWANLPTMTGFGGVAFLACLVPGLNLLIMPALVTAGTLLVLRTEPLDSKRL
jgi:CysZ protein